MKISYLVTCHNETDSLRNLLTKLIQTKLPSDEIIILDDYSDNPTTINIISEACKGGSILIQHPLNKDYGSHKNYGVEKSTGNFIFQIDGDEFPPDSLLGENLHELLESNPLIDAYVIPRINAWIGLTEVHAKNWGWNMDISPTHNRNRAAWPDYQFRIFKRDPKIRFKNRLHERIDGFTNAVMLPKDEIYALYHDKTIETQIATNLRYNKEFTADENHGISNPR